MEGSGNQILNYLFRQYLINFFPNNLLMDCNVRHPGKARLAYEYNIKNKDVLLLGIQNWIIIACIMIHSLKLLEAMYMFEVKDSIYAMVSAFIGISLSCSIVFSVVFTVAYLYLSFVKLR